jgi:hypothetical protein
VLLAAGVPIDFAGRQYAHEYGRHDAGDRFDE